MTPAAWVAFAAAAAVGAPARYLVDTFVQTRTGGRYPLGTFAVNAAGAFALGVVTGLGEHHGLSSTWRVVIGTGGIGAFTTFSTLSFETVRLAEAGDVVAAVTNAFGSVAVGALVAAAGLALAS